MNIAARLLLQKDRADAANLWCLAMQLSSLFTHYNVKLPLKPLKS